MDCTKVPLRSDEQIALRSEGRVLKTIPFNDSPEIVAGNIFAYRPTETLQLALLSKYVGEQYLGNIDSEASILDSYFVNDGIIEFKNNNLSILTSLILNLKDIDKGKISEIQKSAEEELGNSEISDQEKYLLDQKIEVLKSIN